MNKTFYITTTAPYVNAEPHIGFALEIIQADAIARYKKLSGYDVRFGFGTDEHGLKIYRKALEAKQTPQQYCDKYAQKFDDLVKLLNLDITNFIRTTDPKHIQAAQDFWMLCFRSGDIYKKNYKIKYCVGCELEKTDSELKDGKCPIHHNLEIETYEEENYFFRFSKYQDALLKLYQDVPDFVVPQHRLTEIRTFVEKELQDFSISRLKSKMPWGVDVPNDPEHVMYVWFDALIFYLSNIGWPKYKEGFDTWWPVVQLAGKDNLRQQSAIWQAMLMSAGLPNSKQILIHGFITSDGQKMSKSLGNVVNPFDLVKKYGIDPVRYYLLREIPPFEDGDFSYNRMNELYSADLSNELGNLVSRVTTIAQQDAISFEPQPSSFDPEMEHLFRTYQFNLILEHIWNDIKKTDKNIDKFAPWKKKTEERKNFMIEQLQAIYDIAFQLQPFIPTTTEKIMKSVTGDVKKSEVLFPKLSVYTIRT